MVKKVGRKNVAWDVEKNNDMSIKIYKNGHYKTTLLLDTSMDGKINVFFFSDETKMHDCLDKIKCVDVVVE